VDDQDRLYLADNTDRIQVFSTDGQFLRHWQLPAFDVDGPTGLSIGRDGNLIVADTHFYRILTYTPEGELVSTLGGTPGAGVGEFGMVRDAIEDSDGHLFVCETGDGELERVQVFSAEREFVTKWGSLGREPGQFLRPEALAFDSKGRLFVADSCNHRIQIFSKTGELLGYWGEHGSELGQLSYPYDLAFGRAGHLYVCEWANHRVQKFTVEGKSLGAWGRPGRKPGQLNYPWGMALDRRNRIHVADSSNHRVQRVVI
jgi:DNA-binding beta-propeller fold protein YncE